MNTVPTNNYTAPDDTNPPLPFTPRQLETQDNQAPTFINDLFSNDPFDFGYFNAGAGVVPTLGAPPHGTLPRHANPIVRRRRLINIRRRGHARPGAISPSRTASFGAPPQANILAPQLTTDPLDGAYALRSHPSPSLPAGHMFDSGNPSKLPDWRGISGMSRPGPTWHHGIPQPNTHMAVAPQLTMGVFGGTSDPITYPSASRPPGSSSAAFDSGKELSFSGMSSSGIQNIPIPMTSGLVPVMAPALASSSPLTWMTSMTPTPKPFARPWDAGAGSMGPAAIATATSTTYGSAEPRQAPISCCSCYKRAHPFVRVDDTIEWVRPDVMKMVVYFNWSANAETEAHESWEPRGA